MGEGVICSMKTVVKISLRYATSKLVLPMHTSTSFFQKKHRVQTITGEPDKRHSAGSS